MHPLPLLAIVTVTASTLALATTRTTTSTNTRTTTTTRTLTTVDSKPLGMLTTDAAGNLGIQPIGALAIQSDGSVRFEALTTPIDSVFQYDWTIVPEKVSSWFPADDAELAAWGALGIVSVGGSEDLELLRGSAGKPYLPGGPSSVDFLPLGLAVEDGGYLDLVPIGFQAASAGSLSFEPIGDDVADVFGCLPIGVASTTDKDSPFVEVTGSVDVSTSGVGVFPTTTSVDATRISSYADLAWTPTGVVRGLYWVTTLSNSSFRVTYR